MHTGEAKKVSVKPADAYGEVEPAATMIIDLNHPLAGKTLVFDVKVAGVDPPAK